MAEFQEPLKGAGGNLWSLLSFPGWLGCPMLFRKIVCTYWVIYFGILHYTPPNGSLGDTVKCSLQCYRTSLWIFHYIKSRYGWHWNTKTCEPFLSNQCGEIISLMFQHPLQTFPKCAMCQTEWDITR